MNRRDLSSEFDPRIADWLESDPDNAPAAVLDTVLAAFPSIPQRHASRVPWRFSAMNRFAQLGTVAAIAIVLVGAVVLVLRPAGNVGSAPPSASTSAPASSAAGRSPVPQREQHRPGRPREGLHLDAVRLHGLLCSWLAGLPGDEVVDRRNREQLGYRLQRRAQRHRCPVLRGVATSRDGTI